VTVSECLCVKVQDMSMCSVFECVRVCMTVWEGV